MTPPPDSQDAELRSLEDLLHAQSLAVNSGIHEIRGLLIAGGYAKLLLQERAGPLTELQRDYLHTIVKNTRRIKEILSWISGVMDTCQLQLARFRLLDLLQEMRESESGKQAQWQWNEVQCKICITADRKKLRSAILDILQSSGWTGDVSIGLHEGKQRVVIELRGPFTWPNLVADKVQGHESMLDDITANLFAHSRDVVRLHGGSLSAQPMGPENCVVKIVLPVMNADRQASGVANV